MSEFLPKDDLMFKLIFGNPNHPRILIHFLNCLIKGKSKIESIEILKNELTPDYVGLKGSRLDVVAKTADGELINIEIQRRDEGNMTARSLFYWSKLFSGQLNISEDYKHLKRTISINILDFVLFKEDERFWRKNFITDTETNTKLTNLLELHFIELNKMKEVREESPLTFWIEFLQNPYSERVQELCKFVPEIKEAKKVFEQVQSDPEARELYRVREKAVRDQVNAINTALEEGKAQGLEEGEVKGNQEEKLAIARNLLEQGIGLETISKATGLTEKQIRELK